MKKYFLRAAALTVVLGSFGVLLYMIGADAYNKILFGIDNKISVVPGINIPSIPNLSNINLSSLLFAPPGSISTTYKIIILIALVPMVVLLLNFLSKVLSKGEY